MVATAFGKSVMLGFLGVFDIVVRPSIKQSSSNCQNPGSIDDRVSTKQYIVAVGGHGTSLEYLEYPGSNDWMKSKPTHSSLGQLQLSSTYICFRYRFAKTPH